MKHEHDSELGFIIDSCMHYCVILVNYSARLPVTSPKIILPIGSQGYFTENHFT